MPCALSSRGYIGVSVSKDWLRLSVALIWLFAVGLFFLSISYPGAVAVDLDVVTASHQQRLLFVDIYSPLVGAIRKYPKDP